MQPTNGQNAWGSQDAPQPPQETEEVQVEAQSQYDGYELTAPDASATASQLAGGQQLIEWEASEYIQHDKSGSWFVLVGVAALVLLGLALIFRQWTFAVLIIVMAAAVIFFARRPPRTLHYALDTTGIRINDRLFPYHDFRAFGVLNEGPLYSIVLLPTGRFTPATSMYFEERDGERIVDILAARLPMEQIKVDFVDNLTKKLRF